MDRRIFLKSSAAALASLTILPGWSNASIQHHRWLTGFRNPSGHYGAAFIDRDLNAVPILSSSLRLHDVLLSPNGQDIVAPARRPGDLLWIARSNGEVQTVHSPADRHYFGHGAFSPDGSTLFIAENDFDNERGVIGVYDVSADYKRIDEFYSNGIGPHELRLMPDGKHLMIANGGILTHPNTGRAKLNLDNMAPNLTMLSLETGKIRDHAQLRDNWHQLSIRHFAITPRGEVIFGVQDQQKPYSERPMVGIWKPGSTPHLFKAPKHGWKPFNGYIGSIAIDKSGAIAAAASPRGGITAFWDVSTGLVISEHTAPDVCGVAQSTKAGNFLLTTGQGTLMEISIDAKGYSVHRKNSAKLNFDNHCHFV